MEEEEAGRAIEEQEERAESPASNKRAKLATHEQQQHPQEEEEAPILRVEAPCPANPQDLPRKCKRFCTPQGCPFGNSCRFAHLPGSEYSSSRTVNKSKACTKFLSASGCPYRERCHFSHCLPNGMPALDADSGTLQGTLNKVGTIASPETKAKVPEYKTRLCNWFGSANGCRYGDKCHFAHGEEEVRRFEGGKNSDTHVSSPCSSELVNGANCDGIQRQDKQLDAHDPIRTTMIRQPPRTAAASFGRSTKSMISIDANLAGPIIGTSGMHTRHICRLTGAKVYIREHENDCNLKVVEVEGSFEQVKQASIMVKEVLLHALRRPLYFYPHNFKSKVCEKFPQGTCRFGNRCRFVHASTQDVHKPAAAEA